MLKIEEDLIKQGYKFAKQFTADKYAAKAYAKEQKEKGYFARVVNATEFTQYVYIKDKSIQIDEETKKEIEEEKKLKESKRNLKKKEQEEHKVTFINMLEDKNITYDDFYNMYIKYINMNFDIKMEVKEYFKSK